MPPGIIPRRATAVTACRRGPGPTGRSRTPISWCGIRWASTMWRARKTGRSCRRRGMSLNCGRSIFSHEIRRWICRERDRFSGPLPDGYGSVSAARIGFEASASFSADTTCLASIHFGATSRSSSGRFMVKAATTVVCRSHQTLKLLLERSPR
jgi:hypothetical protein